MEWKGTPGSTKGDKHWIRRGYGMTQREIYGEKHTWWSRKDKVMEQLPACLITLVALYEYRQCNLVVVLEDLGNGIDVVDK